MSTMSVVTTSHLWLVQQGKHILTFARQLALKVQFAKYDKQTSITEPFLHVWLMSFCGRGHMVQSGSLTQVV